MFWPEQISLCPLFLAITLGWKINFKFSYGQLNSSNAKCSLHDPYLKETYYHHTMIQTLLHRYTFRITRMEVFFINYSLSPDNLSQLILKISIKPYRSGQDLVFESIIIDKTNESMIKYLLKDAFTISGHILTQFLRAFFFRGVMSKKIFT